MRVRGVSASCELTRDSAVEARARGPGSFRTADFSDLKKREPRTNVKPTHGTVCYISRYRSLEVIKVLARLIKSGINTKNTGIWARELVCVDHPNLARTTSGQLNFSNRSHTRCVRIAGLELGHGCSVYG